MLDVKLKTNDNNNLGFVCVRCTAPENGASLRGTTELRKFHAFAAPLLATSARGRAKHQLYGRHAYKPNMLDVKLKMNDNNNLGFVCVRCTAPENGASPRRHHETKLNDEPHRSSQFSWSRPEAAPNSQVLMRLSGRYPAGIPAELARALVRADAIEPSYSHTNVMDCRDMDISSWSASIDTVLE